MYYIAFILIVLHYSLLLIPIITYFNTSLKQIKRAIIGYMLVLFAINIYYKGCPFIRVERKLLGIPTWIGVHECLRIITPTPSTSLINTITISAFICLMWSFWITY